MNTATSPTPGFKGSLIRRLLGWITTPTPAADVNTNDQARADWEAVKADVRLSNNAAHLAEVREAELAAHEDITDSYGHAVMRRPSAAVLNEFCAFALAQVPHLVSRLHRATHLPAIPVGAREHNVRGATFGIPIKGFNMQSLKKSGFLLLSPFTMVFALLCILLMPDRPELNTKAKPAEVPTRTLPRSRSHADVIDSPEELR
jgi:hypothetical protein